MVVLRGGRRNPEVVVTAVLSKLWLVDSGAASSRTVGGQACPFFEDGIPGLDDGTVHRASRGRISPDK